MSSHWELWHGYNGKLGTLKEEEKQVPAYLPLSYLIMWKGSSGPNAYEGRTQW